jgi:hypothetical protein
VVNAAVGGVMVVQDFAPGTGDTVAFLNSSIADFATAQAAMSYQAGINTTIITDAAGNAVWLIGIAPEQIDASMVAFA